jgi:predicted O-methyltransferase YrrM
VRRTTVEDKSPFWRKRYTLDPLDLSNFLTYIQPKDSEQLEQMRQFAAEKDIPIIKREMKQFLETLLIMNQPLRILEIGTAMGYSSIVMSECMLTYADEEQLAIHTLERSQEMVALATQHIAEAGKEKIIHIHVGEAEATLETFVHEGAEFDLIFMDAAKGQYLTFLPYCMKLLKVRGLLISDNVLQGGDVSKSRFSVSRRQRTIHQRMRQYLWELNHREDLKTSILSIADGATVSIKLY